MYILEPVINSIRDTKLLQFLKQKGITKKDKDIETSEWLDKLLQSGIVTEEEINTCAFNELMYGNRRLIRIYGLKNVRKIKHEEDWQIFLQQYNCPSLNFNKIITTVLDNNKIKVCAISSDMQDGVLTKLQVIFVYNMFIKSKRNETISNCYSYIPVVFNLKEKIITVKVWNREEGIEDNTPIDQIEAIMKQLQDLVGMETKSFIDDHQRVLYRMSKSLFDDFFKNLPNVRQLERKKEKLSSIVNMLLEDVDFTNSKIEDGMITMEVNIINVEDEMYKLLQQVALYDYLKDHEIRCLLEHTDRYISRIKFSDIDNLTASLNSETGVRCIFDAKTFMCVRNSLDLVEQIVSIVVSFPNYSGRGILSVKYDATDSRYLTIHILNDRYYMEDDYKRIWELYRSYESDNTESGCVCIESIDAAV